LIARTKINNGTLILPKELTDRYRIENSMIMLVPMDDGIFIKPIPKDFISTDEGKLEQQAIDNEVNTIITVLYSTIEDAQAKGAKTHHIHHERMS